jgi:hypothetical protein
MIGKPQEKLRLIKKVFRNKSDAEKYINKKIREKLKYKRYSNMPADNYFTMIAAKRPLSMIISLM